MPAAVTDFGAPAWLSALFGVTALPTGYYVALCNTEPGVDTDGTILADLEPTATEYHRQAYGTGPSNWDVNGNYLTNLVDIDFGTAASDWGYLDHFVLCDAATGGDVWAYGELTEPQFVEADFDVILPAGALVLALVSLDDSIAI